MEGGLLLDVVIAESATILKLLACEDQALLIGGNTFLILDLSLHVLDSIGSLNIESDGLAGKGLDEDLHGSAPKSEDQVNRRFLLNIVVSEGSAVVELLATEDQTLLVNGDSFFVLDLGFHAFDRISCGHVEGVGLAREGLDEYLHL